MKGLFGLLRDLRWDYVLRWVYGVRLGDERVTGYLMLPYVFMLWGCGDGGTEIWADIAQRRGRTYNEIR